MSFLGPLISAGVGLIAGNVQNKQNAGAQQAQQNYAQGVSAQAAQLAQQTQMQQLANMFMRYNAYMKSNPQIAQTWRPIAQPNMSTGNIGGGTIGSNGSGIAGFLAPSFLANPTQGQSIQQGAAPQGSGQVAPPIGFGGVHQALATLLAASPPHPGQSQMQSLRGPAL